MLGMKYIDKNGSEWSIERGDWTGYQTIPVTPPKRKISFIKIGLASIAFCVFVVFSLL